MTGCCCRNIDAMFGIGAVDVFSAPAGGGGGGSADGRIPWCLIAGDAGAEREVLLMHLGAGVVVVVVGDVNAEDKRGELTFKKGRKINSSCPTSNEDIV